MVTVFCMFIIIIIIIQQYICPYSSIELGVVTKCEHNKLMV